ncbi:MAG: hypothetical protein H6620_06290 [Halobacteriovoraceae bacterium]|nr:hypothetical protein [Halobacteriovoraceae bacterium]
MNTFILVGMLVIIGLTAYFIQKQNNEPVPVPTEEKKSSNTLLTRDDQDDLVKDEIDNSQNLKFEEKSSIESAQNCFTYHFPNPIDPVRDLDRYLTKISDGHLSSQSLKVLWKNIHIRTESGALIRLIYQLPPEDDEGEQGAELRLKAIVESDEELREYELPLELKVDPSDEELKNHFGEYVITYQDRALGSHFGELSVFLEEINNQTTTLRVQNLTKKLECQVGSFVRCQCLSLE